MAKGKRGRPTVRSAAVELKVIEGLTAGTPLTLICKPDDMPGVRTVYDWMEADDDFAADIARAREAGFDAIAQEILDIIDAEPERIIITTGEDRSESRYDSAAVQWAARRVDARLKLLAKWDPKRYGDMVKHANADGGNIDLAAAISAGNARVDSR